MDSAKKVHHRVKVMHVTTVDMSVRFLLLNQLLFLKEKGFEVSAVCSDGEWIPEILQAGIPVETIEMRRKISLFSDLKALVRLYLHFRRERPEIVHTHTPKAGLLGQLAAKAAGVPVIVNTVHGFYFHDNMKWLPRKSFILMEKIAALCSDSILSQNREDIKTAIKEKIAAEGRMRYLGNGIDISRFDPARFSLEDREGKKREIGVSRGQSIVGFVGRLVVEKGIADFLEAAAAIKSLIPETKFLVIGPVEIDKKGGFEPSAVKETDLASEVIFLGMRKDMPDLYSIMDVLVLPSHREGFPRSPMEAGAMGKPVVATNIRGCREVVRDGRTGILVPLRDTRELSEAVLRLLRDKELAGKMGSAARRLAAEEFDERKVFARVHTEYSRLLEEKGIKATN